MELEYTYQYTILKADNSQGSVSWKIDNAEIHRSTGVDAVFSFNDANLLSKISERGWRILPSYYDTLARGYILLEKAYRIDNAAIEARFNARLEAIKSDFSMKIDQVTAEKVQLATNALRIQLLEAVKDAKLFDEAYKNALLESTEAVFRSEFNAAIETLKVENELR